VFAQAREKARQTSCASNEKQLGLAFIQYTQDYDECMPVTGLNNPGYWACFGAGWASLVYPYVKSTGVFTCPDDPTQTAFTSSETVGTSGQSAVSYAYNEDIGAFIPTSTGGGISVNGAYSKLNSPAVTVELCEVMGVVSNITSPSTDIQIGTGGGVTGYFDGGSAVVGSYNQGSPNQPTAGDFSNGGPDNSGSRTGILATGTISDQTNYDGGPWAKYGNSYPVLAPYTTAAGNGYHTGGSNYLLADGHVKWLRGTAVSLGVKAASATTAQTAASAPAAGTSNLATPAGPVAVTFSPI